MKVVGEDGMVHQELDFNYSNIDKNTLVLYDVDKKYIVSTGEHHHWNAKLSIWRSLFFIYMGKQKEQEQRDETKLAVIANDIGYIKKDMSDIKETLTKSYVSREEFEPIKRLVYGLVSLILVAVVVALLALIIQQPDPK